ncbi:MAG: D-arabinono-1,4-lactone oxidase [Actinomycetota bacterium]|nr:D-arabinono-1,4-lactone oxidase [Actinomycetota bacterium]|tara:strand:- start:20725 stop:21900 length:1176 start_codon:yes stop_codon:yes gene_type:complete
MAEWKNWSGKLSANPQRIVQVGTVDAIRSELLAARNGGWTVRTAGTTHSHYPLLPTDGVILDTRPLSGLVSVDADAMTATFRAGTKIHACGRPLLEHGLGLLNQGDIDQQSVGGAIATGTHGTGVDLGSFSSAVTELLILLVDGSVVTCTPDREPDLFEAARLSLGAVGVILEVTLQVREAYRLEEQRWLEPFESVMERIDELVTATRHFEYFWYPGQDRAICKSIDITEEPSRYPLGDEGQRLAWGFEVLPNQRLDPHTEMEYSIATERGPSCVAEIKNLLSSNHPDVLWPIEYRTVAADNVWLSPARGRATVTVSIHEDVERDETAYYKDAETVFRAHGGRPHWGKVHYLSGEDLAADYDHWQDWWRVRDEVDPTGVLLNDVLGKLRTS